MKNSIIYLGVALVTLTNVIQALGQQSFSKGDSLAQTVHYSKNFDGNTNGAFSIKRNVNEGGNPVSANSEIITVPAYTKTVEEIIAENNQIIESATSTEQTTEDTLLDLTIDAAPVSDEQVLEERIEQDSQIIESPVLTAIQPSALKKSKRS
ncbi:hypothetical protein [Flavobacterium pedocola]